VRIVYVDLLFAVNMVMNTLLLWATAKFAGQPTTGWRLAAGAFVGSLYSLTSLFPGLALLFTVPGKIIFSLLMLEVVFAPVPPRTLARLAGYFYGISFLLGGTYLAVSYLARGSGLDLQHVFYLGGLRWGALVLALALTLLFGKGAWEFVRTKLRRDLGYLPTVLIFDGKRVLVNALVDTGNQLKDPVSQEPVMIVELEILEGVLPDELKKALDSSLPEALPQLAGILSGSPWSTRFRMLPYSTLGNAGGLLLGVKPDRLLVYEGDQEVQVENVVVGIYNQRLSPEGSYRALLPPQVLRGVR